MPPFLYVPDSSRTGRYSNQASGGDQANGGVRGGTLRLLPVDSKAEAKRSSLLSS